MIETKEILCSQNPQGSKLMTMFWRYPKYLHQESLRHRTLYIHDCLYDPDFSFSVSSARAIPFKKLLEEVRSDKLRAAPLVWGCEQKGMSPGEELSDDIDNSSYISNEGIISYRQQAKNWWKEAAIAAADLAEQMAELGLHKSIVNRIIEPYIHVNCLVTGTDRGWLNFFGLRLDQNADPTLQILAQNAWKVWQESKPQLLQPNDWHLPYIDQNTINEICKEDLRGIFPDKNLFYNSQLEAMIRISAARCARLSYLSFDTGKRSTIEEDLKLYNRLVGSTPIHASPLEHQATPDIWHEASDRNKYGAYWKNTGWNHPEQAGNLGSGWRQFRKFLPNESLAPLPEGYIST